MQCPNCGQKTDQIVKFCPNCGAPQTDSSRAGALPESPETTESSAALRSPDAPDAPDAPESSVPSEPAGQPAMAIPTAAAMPVIPPNQEKLQAERMAYVRPDYNPQHNGQVYGRSAQAPNPGPATASQAGIPAPGHAPLPQRPPTTGMVVFSIINMLCCGLVIGFILGLIALIYAIMANSEASYEEARQKLHTAQVLNIIGVVFQILQVVAFFAIIILSVVFFQDNFWIR